MQPEAKSIRVIVLSRKFVRLPPIFGGLQATGRFELFPSLGSTEDEILCNLTELGHLLVLAQIKDLQHPCGLTFDVSGKGLRYLITAPWQQVLGIVEPQGEEARHRIGFEPV